MADKRSTIKAIQAAVGASADGYWGPNTRKAVAARLGCVDSVEAIQAKVGVGTDGIVGPATLSAIVAALGVQDTRKTGTVFLDPGHTRDYSREHPSQFTGVDWAAGKPAEVLKALGITKSTDDSLEHVLNVRIVEHVKKHLLALGHSVVVYDNPALSNNAEIRQVYSRSNALEPDIFVSVHNNAAGATGWKSLACKASGSVALYNGKNPGNITLARALASTLNNYRKDTDGPNNRCDTIASSSVGVLANAKPGIRASLVEVGFYDNIDDLFWMATHLDGIGDAVARAIHNQI